MENLSVNFKRIRRWYGMTIPAFAKKLDIAPNSLAGYEGGFHYPSIPVVVRLSKVSGFTLDELVFTKVGGGLRVKN